MNYYGPSIPTPKATTTDPANPGPNLPALDFAFGPLSPSVALTGFCILVAPGTAPAPMPISTTCEAAVASNCVGASATLLFSRSYTTYADRRKVSPWIV